MSRAARLVLPDFPHHVVHRGHNRRDVFTSHEDYRRYLADLADLKKRYGVKVLAFCLMSNHVHLLLIPESADGMSRFMKHVAGRHTRYLNRRAGRSGTVWESRYWSSLVDGEGYLFTCLRYVELNPVRAAIVLDPGDYPWSSCRHRLGLELAAWLEPYPGLPETHDGYRAFLAAGIRDDERELIREAVRRGQLTGEPAFAERIAALAGRRVERRGPGRPRRKTEPKIDLS